MELPWLGVDAWNFDSERFHFGMVPCVLFEDEHLLVVNKPAGLNTHAPSPFAGAGLYEWLRDREPRWARLAIVHRLDKETSGTLVFTKTALANRSLTDQFTQRRVRKRYVLLSDHQPPGHDFTVKTALVRAGEKYVSRPLHVSGNTAETKFFPAEVLPTNSVSPSDSQKLSASHAKLFSLQAEPVTGRTHQIRVHAAEKGFPILGDTLYGGTPAARVFLHATQLSFQHPATGAPLSFSAPAGFGRPPRLALRAAIIEPELSDAHRLVHGASDEWSGWYVDRLGNFLLAQGPPTLNGIEERLENLMRELSLRGLYHKVLAPQTGRGTPADSSPQHLAGEKAPDGFVIRENGLRFEIRLVEGYSIGLFLDQRENRRRLLTRHVAAGFTLLRDEADAVVEKLPKSSPRLHPSLLNTFAYTCSFSVCAAKAGLTTTSIDLSKKHLEWAKRNFIINGLDPATHEFICGDVFDWLRRLRKKGRVFETILLDPPTFSQSKQSGVFRAEKDYPKLIAAALPLLASPGVLFVSSNAQHWPPPDFLEAVQNAVKSGGRNILQSHYVPQPLDFPISSSEPAYLKTVWMRIE